MKRTDLEIILLFTDTKENKLVVDMLYKIWTHIDSNLESFAKKLYERMFETHPNLHTIFPFHADQMNQVNFNEYQGSYQEPSNSSWFLLFRYVVAFCLINLGNLLA